MKYILLLLIVLQAINIHSQEVLIDGIPRDTSFTLHSAYVKAQKQYPFIRKVIADNNPQIKTFEGVVYSKPSSERSLHVNVYRPNDSIKYPALLMVHGGGWNSGDLNLQVPMAQKIAEQGYVTIPVEYRLSPEAIYPAAVYDLKAAIRWIRANADYYGIDTSKIAISGCSAGGQLAGLIGTTNGQDEYENKVEYPDFSSRVHAVINIDGISDFTVPAAVENANNTVEKGKMSASVKWLGGTFDQNKDNWIAASSVYHVTSQSAPICFINSSTPRFHDGRDEIIEKLSEYNIYTEVHSIPDTPHPFWLFDPWFDINVGYMIDFLDRQFK